MCNGGCIVFSATNAEGWLVLTQCEQFAHQAGVAAGSRPLVFRSDQKPPVVQAGALRIRAMSTRLSLAQPLAGSQPIDGLPLTGYERPKILPRVLLALQCLAFAQGTLGSRAQVAGLQRLCDAGSSALVRRHGD